MPFLSCTVQTVTNKSQEMVNLSANLGAGVERLKVLGEEPLNAEPCLDELLKHTITPEELMYHRNHCES